MRISLSFFKKIVILLLVGLPTTGVPTLRADAAQNSFVEGLIRTVNAAHQQIAVKKSTTPTKKVVTPLKKVTVAKPAPATTAPKTPTVTAFLSNTTGAQPQSTPIDPATLNARARAALVNILCTTRSGGTFRPITGSGVIIDPRGVILTNAHVAQYMLLRDYIAPGFVSCVIRTGSPAEPAYNAELLYLPPAWVDANAGEIGKRAATGTGEHDYALLLITEPVSESIQKPQVFPFISPDIVFNRLEQNAPALVAGYPAELVGGIITQQKLFAASTNTYIDRAYFFNDSTAGSIDLFSVGSTVLAQGGSSGGSVIDGYTGNLLGIVVTTTIGTTTESKRLQAVSLPHINRSIFALTGTGLFTFLEGDLTQKVWTFNETLFGSERQKLINSLERN